LTAREEFLQRVRQAVSDGNKTGSAAPLPERGGVGLSYPGDGADLVRRFADQLTAVGGKPYVVGQLEQMLVPILHLIEEKQARRILLARHPLLDRLGLVQVLRERGLDVIRVEDLGASTCRDPFFQADIGISAASYLMADTGTVALACSKDEPRSVSLLPPVHVVLSEKRQILADLFDLFARFPAAGAGPHTLPSCLSLITGPSKTGDIELRLVTGVHGPGEVHVIVGTWE
jgi:L-lactate dehydrogenase complex protein LldG